MAIPYTIFYRMVSVNPYHDNGYVVPDIIDQKILMSYRILKPYLMDDYNELFDKAFFGLEDDCQLDLTFDIHLLIGYLVAIYKERILRSETGSEFNLNYITTYCIDSIQERFLCRGVKTQDLMQVFGLFGLVKGIEISSFLDGIDHMIIESEDDPINRINSKTDPDIENN